MSSPHPRSYWHALVRSDAHAALDGQLKRFPAEMLAVDASDPTYNYTLLHAACAVGAANCAKSLIAHALSLRCAADYLMRRTMFGTTALMVCVEWPFNGRMRGVMLALLNATELVSSSVTACVDVNARDVSGATALMRGVVAGNGEAAVLLIARGADPYVHDNQGRNALMMAFDNGNAAAAAAIAGRSAVLVPGWCAASVRDLKTVLQTIPSLLSCILSFVTDLLLALSAVRSGASSQIRTPIFIFSFLPSVVLAILPEQRFGERVISLMQLRLPYELLTSMSNHGQRLSVRYGTALFLTAALEDTPQLLLQSYIGARAIRHGAAALEVELTPLILSLLASLLSCASCVRSMFLQNLFCLESHKPESEKIGHMVAGLLFGVVNVALHVMAFSVLSVLLGFSSILVIVALVVLRARIAQVFGCTISLCDPLIGILFDAVLVDGPATGMYAQAIFSTLELFFMLVLPLLVGVFQMSDSAIAQGASANTILIIIGVFWALQMLFLMFLVAPRVNTQYAENKLRRSERQLASRAGPEVEAVEGEMLHTTFVLRVLWCLLLPLTLLTWLKSLSHLLCPCLSDKRAVGPSVPLVAFTLSMPPGSSQPAAQPAALLREAQGSAGELDEGKPEGAAEPINFAPDAAGAPQSAVGFESEGMPGGGVAPDGSSCSSSSSSPVPPASPSGVSAWSHLITPSGCWIGFKLVPHLKLFFATLSTIGWLMLQLSCMWLSTDEQGGFSVYCNAVGPTTAWSWVLLGLLYLIYIGISFGSHTAKYLQGLRDLSGVHALWLQSRGYTPSIRWHVECYHFETRTRQVYRNGQYETETYEEKVVTHTATAWFKFDSWTDTSDTLPADYICVRFMFNHSWHHADDYTRGCYDREWAKFKSDNNRDVYQTSSTNVYLGEMSPAIAVQHQRASPFLRYPYFILSALVMCGWPFALFVGANTSKATVQMRKQIKRNQE